MQPGNVDAPRRAAANVEGLVTPAKPRATRKSTPRKSKPSTPARRKGDVEKAVDADLKAVPASVRSSALAATALAMAREMDNAGNSATAKSFCAGKLLDALEKLRTQVPDKPAKTKLDEIAERREKRLARASGT